VLDSLEDDAPYPFGSDTHPIADPHASLDEGLFGDGCLALGPDDHLAASPQLSLGSRRVLGLSLGPSRPW
jgi:hypothetical protein